MVVVYVLDFWNAFGDVVIALLGFMRFFLIVLCVVLVLLSMRCIVL